MPRTTDIIDPKTAGTIPGLFRERARRTPHACAYRRFNEDENRFEEITWERVFVLAGQWQAALRHEGLLPGDRAAVMLKNCLEWVLFDLAALGLGLVTVPLFADDRPENFAYILNETDSRFLLIEGREQWLRFRQVDGRLPGVKRIITLQHIDQPHLFPEACKNPEAEANPVVADDHRGVAGKANAGIGSSPNPERDPRLSEVATWLSERRGEYIVNCRESNALATIVYTSGTTGMPKGVMLSHANILENAFACLQRESIYPDDLFLSFLPLSHTFERTVGYYIPMMSGACVAHVRSIDKLSEDLLVYRPTILTSVPRIYERIYRKLMTRLQEKAALVRYLFKLTVHTGWKRFSHLQKRAGWSLLFLLWPLLKKITAHKVIARLGGRLRLTISGGAPLALPISRIFIGLGLNLLQGYGLTETSPVISFNTTYDNIPSSVGQSLPGVETAIGTNGELLIKGPTVMLGYWRDKEATKAAIGRDGWFHTGDLARIDKGGHITIAGRLKEIIVLSTGEKIPPEDLEMAIMVNPLFEQVMVVGEGRPFLAALVVLNSEQWEKLATKRGIATDQPGILNDERVEGLLLSEISQRIAHFPGYARIRRVHAMLSPWRMQDGLITNTLKLRRRELLAKFDREVESLFEGH